MPRKSQPLVALDRAGVRRAGRWLVRGVTLSVEAGEIVTLIGPNGSGKSTTAKMALGVLPPDEGAVVRRPGLRVSYAPQRVVVDWTLPLTVARFMRLTGGVEAFAAEKALRDAGVAHLAGAQLRTLSGGEFQRVLIARAIARKPELLVLDEPVQGVDFAGEIALYDLLKRVRDELGCGLLLISHDLHVVMAATDRVLCLNGHVCCSGSPMSVAESAEFKTLFGARAGATGLSIYGHQHDHIHLPDGRIDRRGGHMAPDGEGEGGGEGDGQTIAADQEAKDA